MNRHRLLSWAVVLTLVVSQILVQAGASMAQESASSTPRALELTEASLEARIDQALASGPVLLFFHSERCGYCRTQAPIVDQLATELVGEVTTIRVDVLERPDDADAFGVEALPTIVIITAKESGGYVQHRNEGYTEKGDLLDVLGAPSADERAPVEALGPSEAGEMLVRVSPLQDSADAAEPQAISATCVSCADCATKLRSGAYASVKLTRDIIDYAGSCISLYSSESDMVFDCDGHRIDGDDLAVDPESGIALLHGNRNVIRNCVISDFSSGIQLGDVTEHTITNNTLRSNGVGLDMGFANTSDINNNTIEDNFTGISVRSSNNNRFNQNTVCQNSINDFTLSSSAGNTGDNNTCDRPGGWNDSGTTGCTNSCSGSITCNSCADCTSKLRGSYSNVLLTRNLSNQSGTCVTLDTSDTVFDCDGHTIDGDDTGNDYGVTMASESDNTVKNCTITDFGTGIYLSSSSRNTLTRNTVRSNTRSGIRLAASNSNTISWSEINENNSTATSYGIYMYNSNSNEIYANDLVCNWSGIKLDNSDSSSISLNSVCSKRGVDFDLLPNSTGSTGGSNSCDAPGNWRDTGKSGCTSRCDSDRCATCSDGYRNGDETGADCGGTYCPPCSRCSGTSAKYAPGDTVCNNDWPTSDGPKIGMNTESDSCNLVEVCNADLDFIVTDALTCCEDPTPTFGGPRSASKASACTYAQSEAYNGFFNSNFGPSTLKTCLAHYIVRGFGADAIYMQNYFHGEWCCYGSDSFCPSGCSDWQVDPAAWQMGTSASCAGADGYSADFAMGGHRCVYGWWWFFGTHKYGKDGYWSSDSNWRSNSDSVVDEPAHASINRLSTGTCVDYSFALTTMLRKAGYSRDDVYSVDGDGHGYNLLRLPGESKWHYVDTVGNNGGGVFGGSYTSPDGAWYDYCRNLDDGCSNDVYSQSRSRCPSQTMIFGCESVPRAAQLEHALTSVAEEPAPVEWIDFELTAAPEDQECTELKPCEKTVERETASVASPPVQLQKAVSKTQITLGETVQVGIGVKNLSRSSVSVIVRESFIPGVVYLGLKAKEGRYEGFQFLYHEWKVEIEAGGTKNIVFEVRPESIGRFDFAGMSVVSSGKVFRDLDIAKLSTIVKVVCAPDGICGAGENTLFCPQDCPTGSRDGVCDRVSDDVGDPDCTAGEDPDFVPKADTDKDGVLNARDMCPLTPRGQAVDVDGCACSQKICGDSDPTTLDGCKAKDATCTHTPDRDGDAVPDAEDNCPDVPNSDQTDGDRDGTGDACEAPSEVTVNTTLERGTYKIPAKPGEAAIRIVESGVTFDCNGAVIQGTGTGYGIHVVSEAVGVTVVNCTVHNYDFGIYLEGSGRHEVSGNQVDDCSLGIVLSESQNGVVRGNGTASNTRAGIYLERSAGYQVDENRVANNGAGIYLHTSSTNHIADNVVCGNSASDFYVYSSSNTGGGNTCDDAGDWDDDGTEGCSDPCPEGEEHAVLVPLIMKP